MSNQSKQNHHQGHHKKCVNIIEPLQLGRKKKEANLAYNSWPTDEAKTLLNWFNDLLGFNYFQIEQLGNGEAYACLLDMLFPGIVPVEKIKFLSYELCDCLQNFRIVQDVFDKVSCDKDIPLNKLIELRTDKNIEFARWFKEFFEANYDGSEYKPSYVSPVSTYNETNHFLTALKDRQREYHERLDLRRKRDNPDLAVVETRDYNTFANFTPVDHNWSKKILELVGNKAKLMESFSWLSTVGGGFSALGERDSKWSARAGALSLGQQLKLAELLGDERLKVMCHLFAALAALQMDNRQFCFNYIKRVILPLINAMPYRDVILINILKHIAFRLRTQYVGQQHAIEHGDNKENRTLLRVNRTTNRITANTNDNIIKN